MSAPRDRLEAHPSTAHAADARRGDAQARRPRADSASRGYAVTLVLMGLTVVSILVVGTARWHQSQARQAEDAWALAAAESLAQGGVEAARAARRAGRPVPRQPLGETVAIDAATGRLEVSADGDAVTSCGAVERRDRRPARACVRVQLDRAGEVLSWQRTE